MIRANVITLITAEIPTSWRKTEHLEEKRISPLDVIANRLQKQPVQLDQLPLRQKRRVTGIDWAAIPKSEGHRLRSLGLDEGVFVEPLHRGILFWRDPLAVRVGRMTIAMRRKVAVAITCEDVP